MAHPKTEEERLGFRLLGEVDRLLSGAPNLAAAQIMAGQLVAVIPSTEPGYAPASAMSVALNTGNLGTTRNAQGWFADNLDKTRRRSLRSTNARACNEQANVASLKTAIGTVRTNASLGTGDARSEILKLCKALANDIALFEKSIQGLAP